MTGTPFGRSWIRCAPVVGAGGWPVALDMAEAGLRLAANPVLAQAAAALAPRWEALAEAGLTRASPSALAGIAIGERACLHVEGRAIGGALAHILVRLGPATGLLFPTPHRYLHEDSSFFQRAVREAELAGSALAAEAPPRGFPIPTLPTSARRAAGVFDRNDEATRLLAVCPRGLPLPVLRAASGTSGAPAGSQTEVGFDGRTWVWLAPGLRTRVMATMPTLARRDAHRRLFNAWPVTGWDYLRRAPHAWEAGEPAAIAAQAVPVAAALRGLGPSYALRHLRSLAQAAAALDLPSDLQGRLWADLARLLPDGRRGTPAAAALPCLYRALDLTSAPAERVERLCELANYFAGRRGRLGPVRARRLYADGFALLEAIDDPVERLRKEVRLLNGLAQVAYHEQEDAEALALEERAQALEQMAA